MASTIPSPVEKNRIRFLILKSTYYKQNLPSEVESYNISWVSDEITSLIHQGALKRDGHTLSLTRPGVDFLKKLSSNRIPPMIEINRDMFTNTDKTKVFKVGRSLARELSREISGEV